MKKILMFCVLFFLMIAHSYSDDQRGLKNMVKELDEEIEVGKQYALIIAINKYQMWSPLKNPVRDAKKIKGVLQDRYFIDEFIELYDDDASKGNIIKTFKDLQGKIKTNDSLLIFYAGHGYYDEEVTKNAYWIPVDGGNDSVMQENWLPNSIIRGMISGIKSKHILLVSDSCFSGDLLIAHRGKLPEINNEYLRSSYKKRGRQVLTSGSSEVVPDESSFTRQFLLALEENSRQFVDSLMLFNEVRLGVRGTTPMFGALSGTDHQDGASFLFFLKKDGQSDYSSSNKITDGGDEKDYLKVVSEVSDSAESITELISGYNIIKDIVNTAEEKKFKNTVLSANKKLVSIRNNLATMVREKIELDYYDAKNNSKFDGSINNINEYLTYKDKYDISNIDIIAKSRLEEIKNLKAGFEDRYLSSLASLIQKEYGSYSEIDKKINLLLEIKSLSKATSSKFEKLDNKIRDTEKYLYLNRNIISIKEEKEKFRFQKKGYIIGGAVSSSLCFATLATGITSFGLYGYYGGEIDKYYKIYSSSTIQSEIDDNYNKSKEASQYSNGFLVSGITTTVLGSLMIIPSVVLFSMLGMETKINRELDDIYKQIRNFDLGVSYYENNLNISVAMRF